MPAFVRKLLLHPMNAARQPAVCFPPLSTTWGYKRTRARHVLHEPRHGRHLGPAEVHALEAVPVLRALADGLLHRVRVHHERELRRDLVRGRARVEALDRLARLVELAVADLPPRGFGGKIAPDGDGDGPDPLQGKGQAVRPLVLPLEHAAEDARGEHLAHDPAEVDVRNHGVPEGCGSDFRGVRGGHGLVGAQRDAAKYLSDEEGLDVLRKDGEEDEAGHEEELSRQPHTLVGTEEGRSPAYFAFGSIVSNPFHLILLRWGVSGAWMEKRSHRDNHCKPIAQPIARLATGN